MGAKVKPLELTKRAIRDLGKLKEFCYNLYGIEKTEAIVRKIFNKLEVLENTDIDLTKVRAVDETFLHLKYTYRKLIIKHCKITYRIGKSKIYIVRVFDTRQNPNKNF